jgi:hypothetical protein
MRLDFVFAFPNEIIFIAETGWKVSQEFAAALQRSARLSNQPVLASFGPYGL